jgi:hypothetical protein
MGKSGVKRLEALQRSLLGLHGELTETFAWTALLCDGLCGLMTEHSTDIDPVTHTGIRFAAIWLKRRNQGHATHLQTACGKFANAGGSYGVRSSLLTCPVPVGEDKSVSTGI